MGREAKLQKNMEAAINDVRNERETTVEKQRLLDAAERVQESLAERKADAKSGEEDRESIEFKAMSAWNITSTLLGSGAEQLDADVKRSLATKLIRLTVGIIEDWTRQAAEIDYSDMRKELLKDEAFIQSISKSNAKNDRKDAEQLVDMLVDAWEFITVSEPFGTMVGQLCAQARDKVLAESVANLGLGDELEVLIQNVWLSDLDTPRGKSRLDQSIKRLKTSRLLRVALTHHLVLRAFWHTSQKSDRHLLLDSANESLKVIGRTLPTEELERLTDKAAAELGPPKLAS